MVAVFCDTQSFRFVPQLYRIGVHGTSNSCSHTHIDTVVCYGQISGNCQKNYTVWNCHFILSAGSAPNLPRQSLKSIIAIRKSITVATKRVYITCEMPLPRWFSPTLTTSNINDITITAKDIFTKFNHTTETSVRIKLSCGSCMFLATGVGLQ